jgi:hypothetical protein
MSLGRVLRLFPNYPLFVVSVRDEFGAPTRLYTDSDGFNPLPDIGSIRTAPDGTLDFWVPDDRSYTLLFISPEGKIVNRVHSIDPDSDGGELLLGLTAEQQASLSASNPLGATTPYALWSNPQALALRAPDGRTVPLVVNPNISVTTVAGRTGDVVLSKADVGLSNVDNTSDINKPISSIQQAAINAAAATGPVVSVSGKVGAVTLTKADVGLAFVDNTTDLNKPVSNAQGAAIAAAAASGPVSSVSGRVGVITLTKADVGLTNVDNTADAFKPISFAQQQAINAAALTGPVSSVAGRTGTILLTKSDVGLANVDNTSDASKPVSMAMQTALDSKFNLSSGNALQSFSGISPLATNLGSFTSPTLLTSSTLTVKAALQVLDSGALTPATRAALIASNATGSSTPVALFTDPSGTSLRGPSGQVIPINSGVSASQVTSPNLTARISAENFGINWIFRPLHWKGVSGTSMGIIQDESNASDYPGTECAGWVRIFLGFDSNGSASGLFIPNSTTIIENRFTDAKYILSFFHALGAKVLLVLDPPYTVGSSALTLFKSRLEVFLTRLTLDSVEYVDAIETANEPYAPLVATYTSGNLVSQGLPKLAEIMRVTFTTVKSLSPRTLVVSPSFQGAETSFVEAMLSASSQGIVCRGSDGVGTRGEQFCDVIAYHPYAAANTIALANQALVTAEVEKTIALYSSFIQTAIANRRLASDGGSSWWSSRPTPEFWATEVNISGIDSNITTNSLFRNQYYSDLSKTRRLMESVVLGCFASGYTRIFPYAPDHLEDIGPWSIDVSSSEAISSNFTSGVNGDTRILNSPVPIFDGDVVFVKDGNMTNPFQTFAYNASENGLQYDLSGLSPGNYPNYFKAKRTLLGGWASVWKSIQTQFEGDLVAGFFNLNSGGETLVPEYSIRGQLNRLIQGKVTKI